MLAYEYEAPYLDSGLSFFDPDPPDLPENGDESGADPDYDDGAAGEQENIPDPSSPDYQ